MRIIFANLTIIHLQSFLLFVSSNPYDNNYSVVNLIERRGYPAEIHADILTDDGYFLDMQRIPRGKDSNTNTITKRPPILFVNPLFASSDLYVTAANSLTFDLADLGYDVWLLNTRGSKYSRHHINTTVNYNSSYWSFSWHEKGYYDIPASIDYIISKTGHEKIYYLGYSEGTTDFYVFASERPEYNDKIRLAICVAPSAYYEGTEFPFLQQIVAARNLLKVILEPLGIRGIYFEDNVLSNMLPKLLAPVEWLCDMVINFVAVDEIIEILGFKMTTCELLTFLDGASLNEIMHYAQIIHARRFQRFDYGPRMNQIKYGTRNPTLYDLNKIKCPVALIYCTHDWFAPRRGVNRLAKQLSNVVYRNEIKGDKTLNTHFDYLFRTPIRQKTKEIVKSLLSNY